MQVDSALSIGQVLPGCPPLNVQTSHTVPQQLAAEAELANDLSMDDEFAALEVEDDIEDELARLKASVAASQSGSEAS